MFQTMLPKPWLAVVMPGGISIMVLSSALDKNCGPAGSACEKFDDVAAGVGRFLEHEVSGRRHELKMAVGQARHPGLRLGRRTQAVVRAPQHKSRNGDAMQPVGKLGIALRVVADQ